MKLVPANRADIRLHYKKSPNLILLEEFANSGMDCARLDDLGGRNACQLAASLRNSTKRYGFNSVEVIARNGIVYLLRKEAK